MFTTQYEKKQNRFWLNIVNSTTGVRKSGHFRCSEEGKHDSLALENIARFMKNTPLLESFFNPVVKCCEWKKLQMLRTGHGTK